MEGVLSSNELHEQLPFSMVLDNIDAGVMVYDSVGNVLFANTVMINWRNIPRKEYLKMNVHDFMSVIDVCVFDLVCQEKRRVSRLQYYQDLQKAGGPFRMRIVTGTPIFDGNSNIKYVITLLQDVDEFQHLYKMLMEENKILYTQAPSVRKEKVGIVAKSPDMVQLISVADNIAPLDSTVLLYGESGTGKEVFAHYIHEHSKRKDKPLVTVNCAAFPENLIEAELFGYEKGSFTGANREGKIGLAEAADGGTLFLDEINSLPLEVQGKVLRMIEEKSIQRVGAVRSKKVDFRLIAATNRDLKEMVKQGTFRADLYYRLHVIPLIIPPVRSRKEDIVPLCLNFLEYFCKKYNLKKTFSQHVLDEVTQYQWPGNVREIRNFVERMVVMTPYATIEISSIPSGMLGGENVAQETIRPEREKPRQPAGKLSKEKILAALEVCNNHRGKTAEYLGISRRQLQYKIKEYHIPSRCSYQKDEEE
ncbi:sigma-54 interaction domain-containing protein [Pseudoflavonifractor phocaeensis]|uniref:sigma-54 interaction domain-containing protein n=1 Tax=Pseudoflavonifractor phocaeensis TaxID=1870988 RepID=UPI001F3049EC|nr:sigma 54-interacting transcriptional regulator [Pseudoflavonifractor phocaeensis]MCF2660566.1 sigma 54-interacting transcriptional regulator [Pseudoflavonifractor phocaeensis]